MVWIEKPIEFEDDIIWLEDITNLGYVREMASTSRSRRRSMKYTGNGRTVGYSRLISKAPHYEEGYGIKLYLRRIFYLTSWDRDSHPKGTYSDWHPSEAVNPRTIFPKAVSEAPPYWTDEGIERDQVELAIKDFSKSLAKLIAQNPDNLRKIEWRDLERIVAEIFEGLGFNAELTPPSKDGGKDVILQCSVYGRKKTYIVEVKHWRSGHGVGQKAVKDFLGVILNEKRTGGLFLSTYGYTNDAFEVRSEIEQQTLRFGEEDKIVSLCKIYMRASVGLWSPTESLAEILYEQTV